MNTKNHGTFNSPVHDLDRPDPLDGFPSCIISPSCFECPLPDCLYTLNPSQRQRYNTLVRDRQAVKILAGFRANYPMEEAVQLTAEQLGVNRRTVYRAVARLRKHEPHH